MWANERRKVMRMKHMKLKALRVEHGYNQKDIAKILEIGESTYNLKENGRLDFTQTEIEKLMQFFQKAYNEIFFVKADHELKAPA